MQPTQFITLSVPSTTTVTTLAKATDIPLRVLVRNVGAALAFITGNVQDISVATGPTTGTYRLPAGDEDVFVLAPKQSLYALVIGVGGLLSVSISEALPMDLGPGTALRPIAASTRG